MTADDAIRILRHGVDGMGNEGPEYAEIADLLETLTKKWQTMTFNEIRAAITALQPVPDLVSVRLPESEGQSSEAITVEHYAEIWDQFFKGLITPNEARERLQIPMPPVKPPRKNDL